MFRQPLVPVLKRARIVQIVSSIVVDHLFWITGGCDVVPHGCLIEVLLVIRELKQQRNWRRMTNEMDSVDVASDSHILLELTLWLAVTKIDYARIVASQPNVADLGHSGHQYGGFHAPVDSGENRAPLRAITMSDIREPFRIHVRRLEQQVDPATKINNRLDFDIAVLFRLVARA